MKRCFDLRLQKHFENLSSSMSAIREMSMTTNVSMNVGVSMMMSSNGLSMKLIMIM